MEGKKEMDCAQSHLELRTAGQTAVDEQVGDLFKDALIGQIVDAVSC